MLDDANREDFKRAQLGREDDKGTHKRKSNEKAHVYI